MSNELNQRRKSSLQTMMDIECPPAMPELDLARSNAIKISFIESYCPWSCFSAAYYSYSDSCQW